MSSIASLIGNITLIDENDPSGVQPDSITITLKEHQLKLLNKCQELEHNIIPVKLANDKHYINTKFGVIGDSVGSGKSYVCLALTQNSVDIDIQDVPDFTSNLLNIYHQYKYKLDNYVDTNVIVVPHNVFHQWRTYIKDNTTIPTEYVNKFADIDNLKYDKQVILVSSTMYNEFYKKLVNKYVNRVFFDEADSINIPKCRKIDSKFYWFVTSSIHNLISPKGQTHWNGSANKYVTTIPGIKRTGFIRETFFSIINVDIRFKNKLFLKNSDELIKKSFKLNKPNLINLTCKNTQVLNILNNLVSEDIQQMICANNIDGAIKAMNVDKTDEDNLIKIVAYQLYDDIDNKLIDINAIRNKKYKDKQRQIDSIKKLEHEIELIEDKIVCMRNRIKESNMDPISYMPIENPTIVKCCTQVFDFESITLYLTTTNKPKCPICRTDITKESLVIVTKDEEEETKEEEEEYEPIEFRSEDHTKFENLTNIIQNKFTNNERVIIFSEYYETFDHIIELCKSDNIDYRTLKGNGNVINNIIEWYNTPTNTIKLLFLNARHAGAGLNLQSTSDLIIYHKMNAELEIQVIGRANRFGRVGTLNIWKLLYDTEL